MPTVNVSPKADLSAATVRQVTEARFMHTSDMRPIFVILLTTLFASSARIKLASCQASIFIGKSVVLHLLEGPD